MGRQATQNQFRREAAWNAEEQGGRRGTEEILNDGTGGLVENQLLKYDKPIIQKERVEGKAIQ